MTNVLRSQNVFFPPNHQCFLLHSIRSLRHIHTYAHTHTHPTPRSVLAECESKPGREIHHHTDTHRRNSGLQLRTVMYLLTHIQTPLTALSNIAHHKISFIMLSVCMFVFLLSLEKNRQQSEEGEREDKRCG